MVEGDAILKAIDEMLGSMVTPQLVNEFKSKLPPWIQVFVTTSTVAVTVSSLRSILRSMPADTKMALALRYEAHLTQIKRLKV